MQVLLTINTHLDEYEIYAKDGDVYDIRDGGGQDVTIDHNDPGAKLAAKAAAHFSYNHHLAPDHREHTEPGWWQIEKIQIL